jgi:hypothetical protein
MALAAACSTLLISGCEAKTYGVPPVSPPAPQLTVVAPLGTSAPLPEHPDHAPAEFDGCRAGQQGHRRRRPRAGADITVAVLDRNTGCGHQRHPTFNRHRLVVKLFTR